MGQVKVKWVDKFQFVGTDSSKHSVVMSSQDEENSTGMKPSEMMLVSLGGCTAYDVVNILTKKRVALTGLQISVTGEQEEKPPWRFTHVHVSYRLRGRNLTEKAVKNAIELSKNKYCSVGVTIGVGAEMTYDFTIEEEPV